MRSRYTILLAIAAVLVGALVYTGCGGDDDSTSSNSSSNTDSQAAKITPGTTVKLWIMPNGPQPQEDMEASLAPFTEKTGIKVDVEVVDWGVQLDRIRNAAVSGEGPDITQAGTTQVPFFAALGGFEDLSDRVEDVGGSGAYPEGVWQTTQVVGQDGTWAVPWFTEARSIYYRKDILEKAGVDPATAFKDWDSFRATLQSIKDKVPNIQPFGTPGKKAFDLVHHVMPFVWDAGGAELSSDNSQSTINSPEAATGVDFFAKLVNDGLADKSQLERDGTQVENQFKGGKIAVWIGGPWVLPSADRTDDTNWTDAARKNVALAPMPAGPNGDAFTFVGGSNLMMFSASEHKNEAWEVMKYLSQDQVQTDYAKLLGMFPARVEPQQAVGEASGPNYEAVYQAIQQGRTYSPIPQWAEIENTYKGRFGNILDEAAKGQYSEANVQKQLDEAAKEADALLAQGG
ncbi:MAG TPA: sugar ABC transporter substrate-binding protein [Solirubrobacteraceae bacterium]|nr:sugar ABC transporter substrate-binding protein [Solirubrobacteraceae bacterium]